MPFELVGVVAVVAVVDGVVVVTGDDEKRRRKRRKERGKGQTRSKADLSTRGSHLSPPLQYK